MRNNPSNKFKLEAVLAVCFALHLPLEICWIYINRSPAKFTDTVDMEVYKYALAEWTQTNYTVGEINRKLIEWGAEPLTKLIAGLGEDIFIQKAN